MFKPGQKVVCVDDKQRHYGRIDVKITEPVEI